MSVANGANFLFHVAMSRLLGPATYGALGSILGLTTVVTLAVVAFQAAVTQAVAERRRPHGVSAELSVSRPARRTAGVGLALGALVAASGPTLRGFLHLTTVVPVVLFGGFVAVMVATLVPQGVLMGRLRFRVVAVALAGGALVRLVSGIVFVELGWGLDGAVAAALVNALVTLAVLLWPLRADLRPRALEPLRLRPRSAMLAVVALGGVSTFAGIDTFLARHYLARVGSGYYAAAATAGRIALFLPSAVGMAAFPRLAALGGRGPEARTLVVHAVGAVALLGGTAAVVLAAAPRIVIDVLFGSRYAPAVPALRILGVAAAAIGVVTVCVYALLARRSVWAALSWPAIATLAVSVALVHGRVTSIAWVVLAVSAALLGVTLVSLAGGRRSPAVAAARRRRHRPATSLHTGPPPTPDARTGTDA